MDIEINNEEFGIALLAVLSTLCLVLGFGLYAYQLGIGQGAGMVLADWRASLTPPQAPQQDGAYRIGTGAMS
jgi:hypothetical protein